MTRGLLLATSLVLGCAAPLGAYGDWTRVVSDDGRLAVHLPTPPWQPVDGPADELRLEIPFVRAMRAPTYALRVRFQGGNARARADRDAAAAGADDELFGPRPIETDEGLPGFETVVIDDDFRSTRTAHFDAPTGVVTVVVEANPRLEDDPEVDALIRSLEVLE